MQGGCHREGFLGSKYIPSQLYHGHGFYVWGFRDYQVVHLNHGWCTKHSKKIATGCAINKLNSLNIGQECASLVHDFKLGRLTHDLDRAMLCLEELCKLL